MVDAMTNIPANVVSATGDLNLSAASIERSLRATVSAVPSVGVNIRLRLDRRFQS